MPSVLRAGQQPPYKCCTKGLQRELCRHDHLAQLHLMSVSAPASTPDFTRPATQVLDDGRLTDSKGRTVSFANTVIIMTSNLGAEHLLAAAAQSRGGTVPAEDRERAKAAVLAAAQRFFRPEVRRCLVP